MSYATVARELARYNRWQNESLSGTLSGIEEKELQRDRGMFFGSMLATLDHILLVDRRLMAIIRNEETPVFDPKQRIAKNLVTWRDLRTKEDDRIIDIADKAEEDWFDEMVGFTVKRIGVSLNKPRSVFWSQLFNHQTHHRSQVTSELRHMGVDYGITDIPFNPDSLFPRT
ncbi:DinB family protein [Parvibaculum sp. MBR-TMA-1.3b-4.2]|jgi:uncharacterized damage-inducible protein DinB